VRRPAVALFAQDLIVPPAEFSALVDNRLAILRDRRGKVFPRRIKNRSTVKAQFVVLDFVASNRRVRVRNRESLPRAFSKDLRLSGDSKITLSSFLANCGNGIDEDKSVSEVVFETPLRNCQPCESFIVLPTEPKRLAHKNRTNLNTSQKRLPQSVSIVKRNSIFGPWKTQTFINQVKQRLSPAKQDQIFAKQINRYRNPPWGLRPDVRRNHHIVHLPKGRFGR
jgi:hypothetical protein